MADKSNFKRKKIQRAIEKAEIGLNGILSDERMVVLGRIVEDVLAEISRRFNDTIEIYEIQNIIEHLLIEDGESALAQEYIAYRVTVICAVRISWISNGRSHD